MRASAKRWNMTISICTLYLAAKSGSSHSGDSAGTLVIPSLTFTGAGSGLRTSLCARAEAADQRERGEDTDGEQHGAGRGDDPSQA